MIQEQKDLLLKDLCSRLPYGVKVLCLKDFNHKRYNLEMIDIGDNEVYLTTNEPYTNRYVDIEEVIPYLFPLSSMTEEQNKDIFHNGKFYIDRHNSLCRLPRYEDDYDFVTMEDCLEIFNKLNKYHFDIYGLIPMGLAINATGLNIY